MKGLIFTSFLDFVEDRFGAGFLEDMLDEVELSTGGAYTNVGTYPHGELMDMIAYAVQQKDADTSELARAFGVHTFGVLVDSHGELLSRYRDSFQCIYHVDQTVHKSVRKLYPDAELPVINATLNGNGNVLRLEYRSSRPLMHFARGLIDGCVAHYGDRVSVEAQEQPGEPGTGALFILTRHD